MPYLVMCKDSKDYKVFRFSSAVTIGRARNNSIVLNNLEISRYHAYIEQEQGRYILIDRSRNGTFVDNEKIEKCPLSHGIAFRILDYLFAFVEDSKAESIDEKGLGEQEISVWDKDDQGVETLVPLSKEPDEKTALKSRLLEEGTVVESEKMVALYNDLLAVARINVPVLIIGEAGTGKEHVAHALHNFSKGTGDFVPLNCSSIPEGIFESELFGSVKGAFHNAADKPGKLELANGGTIFLDEIGDMSLSLQPKLLRFIEDKMVTRLGDTKVRELDVRVIAATNQDLRIMMEEKTFRADFYHRLACIKLRVPPLRERKEDIQPLIDFFLSSFSDKYDWKTSRISDNAIKMLMEYAWPGNIRELRNLFLGVSVHVQGKTIYPKDLAAASEEIQRIERQPSRSFPSAEDIEKRHIVDALERTGWNKAQASKLLGISRDTLYRKVRKYKISLELS
jgi:Nif-specific regulatory protein